MMEALLRPRLAAAWLAAMAMSGAAFADAPPAPPARPAAFSLPMPPDVPPAADLLGGLLPKNREIYFPIAAAEARRHDLPPEVADAVMRVESAYQPGATGGVGERGLMQVLPSTAAMLGFSGTMDELADPQTNIRLGVRYLAGAWKLAGGDLCRALMKYRAGHNETRMSALSVEYCRRAKRHLATLGSPLAEGALPAITFGPAPGTVVGDAVSLVSPGVRRVAGRLVRTAKAPRRVTGRAFWAVHTARVKAIEARLPWKRGGIMAGG